MDKLIFKPGSSNFISPLTTRGVFMIFILLGVILGSVLSFKSPDVEKEKKSEEKIEQVVAEENKAIK